MDEVDKELERRGLVERRGYDWYVTPAGTDALKAIAYCRDCGNPLCPKVAANPYWSRCPASRRLAVRS